MFVFAQVSSMKIRRRASARGSTRFHPDAGTRDDRCWPALRSAPDWPAATSNRGKTHIDSGLATGQRSKKLVPLAYLAPPIIKFIPNGSALPSLTIEDLATAAHHLDWQRQAETLGIRPAT